MKKPSILRRGRRTSQPPTEVVTFEQMFQSFSDARRRIAKEDHRNLIFDTGDDIEDVLDEELSSSDTMSVSTYTTLATMDNNIGTGRTVDNFFYQPAGRYVERLYVYLSKSRRGTGVDPLIRTSTIDSSDDNCSMLTTSTATATDLPGPGRVFDKYVYQVTGRLLEQCAGRIAMRTFVSADAIAGNIVELWKIYHTEGQCSDCMSSAREMSDVDKVRHAIGHIEKVPPGSFILAAIKELISRSRSSLVMRRYGAKFAWLGQLRGLEAIKLLVYVEQFQIDLVEDPSDVMKAHSKVFGGLHSGRHLTKQKHFNHELLGGLYELMRTKIVEESGRWTHDWLNSIVRESIDDLWGMVRKSSRVHERSLMKLSLRINSAIMWSLVQLLHLSDSEEEIDCDQLVGALEGVYAAMIVGFTLKGDRDGNKSTWNDEYDVTGKSNLQKIMLIVHELQDDYVPEPQSERKRRRCLCLRKYLVLERINYLILLKGCYSKCEESTTWARLIQCEFMTTGMQILTRARPIISGVSDILECGRMLFLLVDHYLDGATRAENHMLYVPFLRKYMETDSFGSEYAQHASGHMDLTSYWNLLEQEGSNRSSIFEGLSDDGLWTFAYIAHRIRDDGSTEELKDYLAQKISEIQEGARALRSLRNDSLPST